MTSPNPFSAMVVGIPLKEEFVSEAGASCDDVWEIVLNVGTREGVEVDQSYVIFALGPEIKDPQTGESLGHFEIIRGTGRVTHVQERMCTVLSKRRKLVPRSSTAIMASLSGEPTQYREVGAPFEEVAVGDFARRV